MATRCYRFLLAAALTGWPVQFAWAELEFPGDGVSELQRQVAQQAAEIEQLRQRLDHYDALYETQAKESSTCDAGPKLHRLPVVVEQPATSACDGKAAEQAHVLHFIADYDNGYVLRPVDSSKHPFELKTNAWIQFRYHAFSRDVDTWTDNAGVTRPVQNRNAFDIERARLVFSGYAQDPRLTYFLQLDGDTDGGHNVDFFDYWWGWEFSDSFQMQLGKRKVPASRQWLLGARSTRLIDRPMACDFFRPDRTVGLFGVGKIGEVTHYEVMAGNGYATANLPDALTDNQLTLAATNYFDPLGDFGNQLVDFTCSCDPLIRVGYSFVYSPQAANLGGTSLEEADFARLTDGTRLTAPNALTPGVTVSDFDVYFYGVDLAWKYAGWSCNCEAFFRWIEEIRGDGPLTINDLYQGGYYVEGGRFLVAQKLDVNMRYSQVNGLLGNSSEYAAGINWYPLQQTTLKVSVDVTVLDGSPLQNTTSDILVGDDGLLLRSQVQAEF